MLSPRAYALSLCFAASGCVGSGLRTPAYVDLVRPQPADQEQRLRALLDTPTLPHLLEAASLGNPRVAAARYAAGAVEGEVWQAELYPNPTLRFETEEVPAGSPGLERSENLIGLRQPVIVGNRRTAAVAAARADLDARTLTAHATFLEVAAEVRVVWVELLWIHDAATLLDSLLETAERTYADAQTRLATRAILESRVLEAQVHLDRLSLRRRQLEPRRLATLQRLAALLGLPDLDLPRSERLPSDLPALPPDLHGSLASHPALLAAYADVEAGVRDVELAEAERIPDVTFQVAYGRNNGTNQEVFEGNVQIPLPVFDRNQGRIHTARQREQQRRREAEALERRAHAELSALLAEDASARDGVETYRDRIVPAAERAFAQAQAGYRAGRGDVRDVLDAQHTLAQAKLAGLEALRDAHQARARLTQWIGSSAQESP